MDDTATLIQAVKDGDVERYGELVRLHQAAVRAFIATYCPNWETVDDVAQQTFIWAFEHLDEFAAGTHFHAWLKAIARNKLLAEMEVKRRDSGRRQKYVDFVQTVSAKAELDQCVPDESGIADVLRLCLDKLPEELRELLSQRYTEEVAIRDLAAKLKKTETALKVTLFRVRQTLKRCVEQNQKYPDHAPATGVPHGT